MSRRARSLHAQMSRSRAALNRPQLETTADAPLPEEGSGSRLSRDLLIVQTYVVDGPVGTGISHYEIQFAPWDGDDAPRLKTLTRDFPHYRLALEAEGSSRRFDITWHPSQRPNGDRCRRLDALIERTPTP
jgi:hypothetical protein